MATLSITIPDAYVPRVKTAFGHRDPNTQAWVDATTQEVLDALKAYTKGRTIDYETTVNATVDRQNKSQEVW